MRATSSSSDSDLGLELLGSDLEGASEARLGLADEPLALVELAALERLRRLALDVLGLLEEHLGVHGRVRHPPGGLVAGHDVDGDGQRDDLLDQARQLDVRDLEGRDAGEPERGEGREP